MIESIKVLDAVTETTTSGKVYVGNAKRVGFLFRRTLNSGGGSTAFSVNIGGEPEGTETPTMLACNMLITNTANTNAQNLIRVASISLAADTDAYAWLDPACVCTWVSVTSTETTGGSGTAFVIVETE